MRPDSTCRAVVHEIAIDTEEWKPMRYAKAGVAVLSAIASAIVAAAVDGNITTLDTVNVAIAGASAASVFTAPNMPHAPVTKFTLAVIMAVLQAAVTLIADPHHAAPWWQLLVAAAGAIAVYGVSNTPEPAV
jgi:hypothetical protein